ncbi:hypothetical protein T484DRAFT_1844580 [Baffinella frigidus]|nr:hypothetical protein T484DRAFT_1844580 [Cryptophyta sp. CCMP2293]
MRTACAALSLGAGLLTAPPPLQSQSNGSKSFPQNGSNSFLQDTTGGGVELSSKPTRANASAIARLTADAKVAELTLHSHAALVEHILQEEEQRGQREHTLQEEQQGTWERVEKMRMLKPGKGIPGNRHRLDVLGSRLDSLPPSPSPSLSLPPPLSPPPSLSLSLTASPAARTPGGGGRRVPPSHWGGAPGGGGGVPSGGGGRVLQWEGAAGVARTPQKDVHALTLSTRGRESASRPATPA